MRKKTKKRLLLLLWLLILGAGAALVLVPPQRQGPKPHWRAPVHVSVPEVPGLAPLEKAVTSAMGEITSTLSQAEAPRPPDLPPEKGEPSALMETPPIQAPVVAPARPQPLLREPLTPPPGGRVRLAIIIDDMGLVPAAAERAVRLPPKVTLSYLPYASRLADQAERAQAAGHELMLHLPMEPLGREKPGPEALLVGDDDATLSTKLDKALNSFTGYAGVNNHMGSKFTLDRKGMDLVLKVLAEKNVYFVDSRTSAKSIAEEVARTDGVRTVSRDVFVDDDQSLEAIREQLRRVEQIARRKGWAVAIGHPHSTTLQALEGWLPGLEAKGIDLVPVSALVQ